MPIRTALAKKVPPMEELLPDKLVSNVEEEYIPFVLCALLIVENKVCYVDVYRKLIRRCSGFGKAGCKTCKAAGVECVFPESQKRGYFPL